MTSFIIPVHLRISHFQSSVKTVHRYLNCCTCLISTSVFYSTFESRCNMLPSSTANQRKKYIFGGSGGTATRGANSRFYHRTVYFLCVCVCRHTSLLQSLICMLGITFSFADNNALCFIAIIAVIFSFHSLRPVVVLVVYFLYLLSTLCYLYIFCLWPPIIIPSRTWNFSQYHLTI